LFDVLLEGLGFHPVGFRASLSLLFWGEIIGFGSVWLLLFSFRIEIVGLPFLSGRSLFP